MLSQVLCERCLVCNDIKGQADSPRFKLFERYVAESGRHFYDDVNKSYRLRCAADLSTVAGRAARMAGARSESAKDNRNQRSGHGRHQMCCQMSVVDRQLAQAVAMLALCLASPSAHTLHSHECSVCWGSVGMRNFRV